MGLDARVYVNVKRLSGVVDLRHATVNSQTGEVTLDSEQQFIAVHKRLGNAAMIGWLSERVASALASIPNNPNPLLITKGLYSGTHSGDVLNASDLPQLQREIQTVKKKHGRTCPARDPTIPQRS
jgi:hypothetical protein